MSSRVDAIIQEFTTKVWAAMREGLVEEVNAAMLGVLGGARDRRGAGGLEAKPQAGKWKVNAANGGRWTYAVDGGNTTFALTPPPARRQLALAFPGSTTPRPFVKWVGGKRQLLPALLPHVPPSFGTYFEPFVGGGALFFHLLPGQAVLGDSNERLVRAYSGVKNDVERVISRLRSYPHSKSFYVSLREKDIDGYDDEDVAAWLIYLNKTGYNGLYRVNSRNAFNVPYGDHLKPNICDIDTLRASAVALRKTILRCGDFETTTSSAIKGDFVYFDPPYVPLSTKSFTSYTSAGFGMREQEQLRDVALALKRRGVHVLLSNSATKIVERLYGRDFELVPVLAERRVNRNVAARGAVREYLIK